MKAKTDNENIILPST